MIGFESIKSKLLNDYKQGKLHHAILLNGKKGIGKFSFAKNFALEILNFNGALNKQNQALASNHADLLIIQKQENKRDIAIEQIREIKDFCNQTSAISHNKFIIIDNCETMSRNAANGLLKILEEPNSNNFLILISHNSSKLLPTIKSRCAIVKVDDLSQENFTKILQKSLFKFLESEINILSIMCENSPAKAINDGRDMIEIYDLFLNSIKNKVLSDEINKKISDKNFNFEIFCEIIIFFLNRLSLYKCGQINYFIFNEKEVFAILEQQFSTQEIFYLSQKISEMLAKSSSLSLDKKLLLINIFNSLGFKI